MATDPAAVALPPSAFSSRAPSRAVVPPSHLPLPPSHFPLLHSLLDSPQYRQTVEKHPELFRTPSYNNNFQPPALTPSQQNGNLSRSSSARRPSATPSSIFSPTWKRGKGRNSAQPVERYSNFGRNRTPSFPQILPRVNGGGGGLPRPVAVSHGSSSSWQNLVTPRILGQDSVNPSPTPYSNLAKVRSDLSISIPQMQSTDGIDLGRDQKWELVDRAEVPFFTQTRSSVSLVNQTDPNLCDGVQASPRRDAEPSRKPQIRERRSMPSTSTSSYPFHQPRELSTASPIRRNPSSSFSDTIQQLKRMLNPSRPQPRPQSPSKSSRSSSQPSNANPSRSRSDSPRGAAGGESGKTVNPKLEKRTNSTQVQRYQAPCHGSAHDFLSARASSSAVPRRKSKPVSKPLLARAPLLPGATDLPSYLESRRQLLQLLREGPGTDVARSSSVLQATIRSVNERAETSRSKPRFKWLAGFQQSRKRKVEEWSDTERGVGKAERREHERSSTTLFQSRISNRPQSHHDRQSSPLSEMDRIGIVNLPSSVSLHSEEQAYSTYGERWELERDEQSEEKRVWDQWRSWIRERRDYLQGDK